MYIDDDASDTLNLSHIFTKSPTPPPPQATYASYARPKELQTRARNPEHGSFNRPNENDWDGLSIRLVGSHPLWGHHLWNAARCFAAYLDRHSEILCQGQSVLELGAGGGLPSLVSLLCGARRVVMTDYPDRELVENMEINVKENVPTELQNRISAKGYIWGRPVHDLLKHPNGSEEKFDLILMSDLIFNHSQHDALLQTAELCLTNRKTTEHKMSSQHNTPCVLVFYTHHRPHLAQQDLAFFTNAQVKGWTCQEIVIETFEPMFPDDPGDEAVRSSVHGWYLSRATK